MCLSTGTKAMSSSGCILFNCSAFVSAAGSTREVLQTNRQPEEPTTPSTTTLPAQFKQRTPMYNSNSNPPATTPTSPLTPTTPPAISPAAQAPQVTPQTQQQPPPKKSLSLTVRINVFLDDCFSCTSWKLFTISLEGMLIFVLFTSHYLFFGTGA